MESLSWLAALTLLAAPQSAPARSDQQPAATTEKTNPSPTKESVTPDKRPEDRPAHESPYSAFSAPHAKKTVKKKSAGARVKCADGTIQTQGQQKDKSACADHGGAKQ